MSVFADDEDALDLIKVESGSKKTKDLPRQKTKDLSYLNTATGGALVSPPAFGGKKRRPKPPQVKEVRKQHGKDEHGKDVAGKYRGKSLIKAFDLERLGHQIADTIEMNESRRPDGKISWEDLQKLSRADVSFYVDGDGRIADLELSEKDKQRVVNWLVSHFGLRKDLSYLNTATGGALVPPPAFGGKKRKLKPPQVKWTKAYNPVAAKARRAAKKARLAANAAAGTGPRARSLARKASAAAATPVAGGACQPGQTAAQTGCIPASGTPGSGPTPAATPSPSPFTGGSSPVAAHVATTPVAAKPTPPTVSLPGGAPSRPTAWKHASALVQKLLNGQALTPAELSKFGYYLNRLNQKELDYLSSLLNISSGKKPAMVAAIVAAGVGGNPIPTAPPPSARPTPPSLKAKLGLGSSPAAPLASTIPYADETDWETGVAKTGEVLNGIPFAPAPPKFWEKTPDVNIDEPRQLRPVVRAGIMIKEPDGRIWIVQPTNGFGGRTYTLPGGTNEPGLSIQQNALKEVWEETGLQVKITGHLGDFEDSNNGKVGRLYVGERIGGAPWDAKIEATIRNNKTGKPAAESEKVTLVTPEKAAERLHRTDDLAQLATVAPIKVNTKANGNMMKKLVDGLKPAGQQYADRLSNAGNYHTGDTTLHAVQNLRKFNEKPEVLNKNDMDALIAKGDHIEVLRGVQKAGRFSAKDLADQFKTGTHYPGYGCFGSGTYTDSNKGQGNVANGQYGYGGDTIRIAIPKTAKIIKQSELEKQVQYNPSNYSTAGGHSTDYQWQGVQAALAGYDAIEVDGKSTNHGSYGKGFYVILNRSICSVQKESAKGHVIQ